MDGLTAFSDMHTRELSETLNLGQLWHTIADAILSDAITLWLPLTLMTYREQCKNLHIIR